MKKIYTLLAAAIGFAATANAQCYTVQKDTGIVYSTVYNLKMDIYRPVGAPAGVRPVLIMAHGGSFIGGNKEEPTSAETARRFASRGYTTASINYRLQSSVTDLIDSNKAAKAVIQAVGDFKAAVRYFRADAAGANLYSVDTALIYVGGNSAGAIAAVNLAYLSDTSEAPAYIKTVIAANGGIDGNSGNPGFSAHVAGVINYAGGVKDTLMINAGEPKIFSAHGDADMTVPYDQDIVLEGTASSFGYRTITICGSGAMKPRLDEVGITNRLRTYVGADHVPWQSDATIFNEIDSLAAVFLAAPTCYDGKIVAGISEAANAVEFGVFPNPSNGTLSVKLSAIDNISKVVLTDNVGRIVSEVKVTGNVTAISNSLAAGYYSVTLVDNSGKMVGMKKAIVQ